MKSLLLIVALVCSSCGSDTSNLTDAGQDDAGYADGGLMIGDQTWEEWSEENYQCVAACKFWREIGDLEYSNCAANDVCYLVECSIALAEDCTKEECGISRRAAVDILEEGNCRDFHGTICHPIFHCRLSDS